MRKTALHSLWSQYNMLSTYNQGIRRAHTVKAVVKCRELTIY